MDIDLLSKMVKELILDNDRVVLPGLGAFVAEIVPSTFSDKGYTINPPYRRLFFRSKPNEGDELAELYARGNKVDKAVAERIIKDYVAELKTILHTRKTVVFPGLGRLRATKENNVFFVADEDLDIYPAGFGLEPISLKTHQETDEEVAAAVEDLKSLLLDADSVVQPEDIEEEVIQVEETVVQEDKAEELEMATEEEVHIERNAIPEEDAVEEENPVTKKKVNVLKVVLTVFGVIFALVLLSLAALAMAGRIYPEWIDQYLYTPEELKILNHIL